MFRFSLVLSSVNISVEIFDFSRLVSLFAHCAESAFKQLLLSKSAYNEQNQYLKTKSKIETGLTLKIGFTCPVFEL